MAPLPPNYFVAETLPLVGLVSAALVFMSYKSYEAFTSPNVFFTKAAPCMYGEEEAKRGEEFEKNRNGVKEFFDKKAHSIDYDNGRGDRWERA